MKGPYLERSVGRGTGRKNVWWICVVTKEGGVLCVKLLPPCGSSHRLLNLVCFLFSAIFERDFNTEIGL
jgi:hypothetical protein